jgi:hypothetical protein
VPTFRQRAQVILSEKRRQQGRENEFPAFSLQSFSLYAGGKNFGSKTCQGENFHDRVQNMVGAFQPFWHNLTATGAKKL